jgi:hypothetical protein
MADLPWLYINLTSRLDRKAQIEQEIRKVGGTPIRIQGVRMRDGLMGCARGHVRALEYGLTQGWPRFAVAEDDLEFIGDLSLITRVLSELPECDVFLPSTGAIDRRVVQTGEFHKVVRSQTSSSYIIQASYVPKLLRVFQDSIANLKQYPKQRYKFAHDLTWCALQAKDNWLTVMPPMARQRESYSDIEKRVIRYDV